MLLTIVVGLYASRVLLEKLGFEDYGIYNVVGGVIVLFSFLSTALNSATQRFLSVELGKGNIIRLKKVFSTSVYIYLFLALTILVGGESIGLWFLNTQMNFPSDRMSAVNWVYQISIITFIVNAIRTPFNACIISYEKMSFYAYISIIETIFKLLVIYIIDKSSIDKLILYALLVLVISIVLLLWYIFYTHKQFPHLRIENKIDKFYFKEMFSFSGWSLFGSLASIASSQGVNILLNIFCGVLVNAGMGIANQVTNVINQFTSNFQIAFNPQLVKGYANKEFGNVRSLVFLTSKISFYLLFIIAIPFLIESEYILHLWLTQVPQYASEFISFLLIMLMIEALAAPLYMIVQATGHIKQYQLIVSFILLLNLIMSFITLKMEYSPVSVVVIRCIVSLMLLCYRLSVVSKILAFPISNFIRNVLWRIILVALFCFVSLMIIKFYVSLSPQVHICFSIIIAISTIFLFGISASERRNFIAMVNKRIFRQTL